MASKEFDKYLQLGEQRVREGLLPNAQKGLDEINPEQEGEQPDQEQESENLTERYPPRAKTSNKVEKGGLSR